jgi:hypothetical protein
LRLVDRLYTVIHKTKEIVERRHGEPMLERIYNPITAMGFEAMFTFQLDNTKR